MWWASLRIICLPCHQTVTFNSAAVCILEVWDEEGWGWGGGGGGCFQILLWIPVMILRLRVTGSGFAIPGNKP